MAATLPLTGDGQINQNTDTPAEGRYKLADRTGPITGPGHTLNIEGSNANGTNQAGGIIILHPGLDSFTPQSRGFMHVNGRSSFYDRVGIGTLTPMELLQVAGNIEVGTGTGTAYNNSNARVFTTQKIFNVKDFGAVGNGLADDTASIKAAIAAAAAAGSGGGIVYFPEGNYLVSESLIIPQSASIPCLIRVQGAGMGQSFITFKPRGPISGWYEKVSDGLNWNSGEDFAGVEVGDVVEVGTTGIDIKVVRWKNSNNRELKIHGTWSPGFNATAFFRRSIFRVQDVDLYVGFGDFGTLATALDKVSSCNNVTTLVTSSPNFQFIKANADDISAWTPIKSSDPTWPPPPDETLTLTRPYRGGNYDNAPFTIKRSGGTAFSMKDIGMVLESSLDPLIHSEKHIGIDLGVMGLSTLERVLVQGVQVSPASPVLLDIGIAVRQHHNFVRYPQIAFCRVGIEVSADVSPGIVNGEGEANQARIENGYINFCRDAGIHIRGYQNIVSGCVFAGTGALGIGPEPWTQDTAIVIESVADFDNGNNGWANMVVGNYFEFWINHITVKEKGTTLLSNFHSGTGHGNTGNAYYVFFPGRPNLTAAEIEASTTKTGNTFNNPGVRPNSGTFAQLTNANQPGDMTLAPGGTSVKTLGVVWSNIADVTVANSTTETTLLDTGDGIKTIVASGWRVGRTIRFRLWAIFRTTGTPTIRFKFKLGSTVIVDTNPVSGPTNASSNRWICFEGEITCRAVGASGSVMAAGKMWYDNAGGAEKVYFGISPGTAVTVNTTISQAMNITVQWGTANASNTITTKNAQIEILG